MVSVAFAPSASLCSAPRFRSCTFSHTYSTPVHLMIILGGYELWPSSSKFPVPGSLEVTFHEVKNLQPNDIKHNQVRGCLFCLSNEL